MSELHVHIEYPRGSETYVLPLTGDETPADLQEMALDEFNNYCNFGYEVKPSAEE